MFGKMLNPVRVADPVRVMVPVRVSWPVFRQNSNIYVFNYFEIFILYICNLKTLRKMRKLISILCLVTVVILASCSKSKTTSTPDTNATFKFSSISANDTVVKVNDLITLTANATGDGLNYEWSAAYGTFTGNGAKREWTVCHEDKFTISCTVTDKYSHSETKTIVVRSHN
jgi:hypothetical protein